MTLRATIHLGLFAAIAVGAGCRIGEGLDPAGARCVGVTCDTPPPPVCLAPGFQRTSAPQGTCQLETGQCEYPYVETVCPLGCFQSKRCRVEGDELGRVRVGSRWVVTPEATALLVAPGSAPGCDAGVFEVRTARLPGLVPGEPRWTGCRDGYLNEQLSWPMVAPGAVVLGYEGLTGSILEYRSGVRFLGEDGGSRATPRAGRAAYALDEDGGVFWSALDVAAALTPEGTVRWSRPCPGMCGTTTQWAQPPPTLVIPGRAFVSCRTGCAAFTPEGEPLFALPELGGVNLLLTDAPDRILVSTSVGGESSTVVGGLAAVPLSGADAGRVRYSVPDAGSRSLAAVVEQAGTVLLASALYNPQSTTGGWDFVVIRLEPASLTEVHRAQVPCEPTGLVARRDGSTLLAMWCRDTQPEPGPAILVLDPALEVTARLRLSGYSRTVGPLSVDEDGNIWVGMDGTLVVLTGTQPPAQSAWPMVRADAQNSSRANLPP